MALWFVSWLMPGKKIGLGADRMVVTEIFDLATKNLMFIAPALLVFTALAFSDALAGGLVRLIKRAAKEFKI